MRAKSLKSKEILRHKGLVRVPTKAGVDRKECQYWKIEKREGTSHESSHEGMSRKRDPWEPNEIR